MKSEQMREKAIETIRHLIGIDVTPYRTDFTKQFECDGQIIIEWREMPTNDWKALERFAHGKNSPVHMEEVGVWGKAIWMK